MKRNHTIPARFTSSAPVSRSGLTRTSSRTGHCRRRAGRSTLAIVTATLLILTSLLPAAGHAVLRPTSPLPFGPGERISYNIRYLSMRVGEAEVTVSNDDARDLWPLEVRAHTRGLFNRIHRIDQEFRSHFDPDLVRATGSDLRFEEKGKLRTERVRIDGETAQVLIRKGGQVTDEIREIPPDSHDILSAIFHLRTLPMKVGDEIRIPIFTGHHGWEMTAKVVKHERVDTDYANIPALVLHCRTHFKGKFKSDSPLRLWISDDDLRVPVRVEAEFALGTMRATLSGYDRGDGKPIPRG